MACAPYSMAQMVRNPEGSHSGLSIRRWLCRRTDNVSVVPALDGVKQAHRPLMGNQLGNLQTRRIHDHTTGSHEITRLLSRDNQVRPSPSFLAARTASSGRQRAAGLLCRLRVIRSGQPWADWRFETDTHRINEVLAAAGVMRMAAAKLCSTGRKASSGTGNGRSDAINITG